jgi:toxin CcdB
LFDSYRRRVVVPLVKRSNFATSTAFDDMPLNPVFIIDGVAIILHPLEVVSISLEQLGDKVMSLAPEGDRITAALDELLTRAWSQEGWGKCWC